MIHYKSDNTRLGWIDPASIQIHPDYDLDATGVDAALAELCEGPGGSLDPVIVLDGVCQAGNSALIAYRIAGVKSALAVVVKRATIKTDKDAEPEKVIGFALPERETVEDDGDDDGDG